MNGAKIGHLTMKLTPSFARVTLVVLMVLGLCFGFGMPQEIDSCPNPNNRFDMLLESTIHRQTVPSLRGPWKPLMNHQSSHSQYADKSTRSLYSDFLKILNLLRPFYLPKVHNVGGDCQVHLNLMGKNDWTMQMVDSWGKFPDGILMGNTQLIGFYEECVDIHVTEATIPFQGKYCKLAYKDSDNASAVGVPERLASGSLWYATCMPSSCTDDDLKDSVNEALAEYNLQLSIVECQLRGDKIIEYTAGTIVMIVILCIIGVLMISSLCVEFWIHQTGDENLEKDSRYLKYLFVWSPYRNMGKIFHVSTKETPESISCLHGLRTLSMTWVVYGHVYIYDFTVNRFALDKTFNDRFLFQMISNFLPCVDSFFFMSGLLVAYNLTREIEKTKVFNFKTYYLHRFLRLSPPMFLIVGLLSTIPPLIISGPMAPSMFYDHAMVDRCRRFWYRDPLFINNFWYYHGDTENCLPQCWYMANDMDLYIVAPLMILPLIFYGLSLGGVWLTMWTILSVAIPAIITGVYQLPPTQGINISQEDYYFYTTWLYSKPWARASPYIVGLWLGYYMWKYRNAKIVLKQWIVVLGWLVATVCGVGVVFGMNKYMQMYEPPPPYNAAESIIYGGFQRLAWGVAVGWVTFACKYGYGGPVNSFLSHPSWQPLSRLTYCMYLISTPTQEMMFRYAAIVPSYYNSLVKLIHAVGSLFIIGLLATAISLMSELPVLGLERLTLRKPKVNEKDRKKEETKPEIDDNKRPDNGDNIELDRFATSSPVNIDNLPKIVVSDENEIKSTVEKGENSKPAKNFVGSNQEQMKKKKQEKN